MKAEAARVFLLAACLSCSPGLFLSAQSAPAKVQGAATATEGFRTEGAVHVSTAFGLGASAAEAEEQARGAALRGLFDGLGKDRLFAEVFTASPPISLSFELLSSVKEGGSYNAGVELRVDAESLSIIERGPYLAAAISILDKTEAASDEAESRRKAAGEAEAAADLGAALGQYGMAADACRNALELIDPVGDPSLFSSAGKRTSPELKKGLSAMLAEANAGIDRVKKAQAALAADASAEASAKAVGKIAEDAIAAADQSEALLADEKSALSSLGSCDSERLLALRDRIEAQRRALADAKAALDRALASRAKPKGGFADDKLDYASRRLATADSSLAAAYISVDREIRDPAARRAARAAAWRWALLHEPREYASLRAYLPFAVGMEEKKLEAAPFEARLGLEGAFAFGSGGVWLRTRTDYAVSDLEPDLDAKGEESAFTQGFDFGFWGKGLFFGGYRWDWARQVDGLSSPNKGVVELGLGGVYPHGSGSERFSRADWLAALSYQLPYKDEALEVSKSSRLYNALNAGLETQFRLGKIGLFEASVSERLAQRAQAGVASDYVSVLSWAIGLGIRLPYPFAVGAEYSGDYIRPLLDTGILGQAARDESGRFRFYIQYSL